jgi:glutaredoxin-related protein
MLTDNNFSCTCSHINPDMYCDYCIIHIRDQVYYEHNEYNKKTLEITQKDKIKPSDCSLSIEPLKSTNINVHAISILMSDMKIKKSISISSKTTTPINIDKITKKDKIKPSDCPKSIEPLKSTNINVHAISILMSDMKIKKSISISTKTTTPINIHKITKKYPSSKKSYHELCRRNYPYNFQKSKQSFSYSLSNNSTYSFQSKSNKGDIFIDMLRREHLKITQNN